MKTITQDRSHFARQPMYSFCFYSCNILHYVCNYTTLCVF